MYIVMGHTRGDDLIHTTSVPLFASPSRDVCETKMVVIQQERDDWLANNEVPAYAQCAVYVRYEIVETPF